jgi:putative DNA primase/helicase
VAPPPEKPVALPVTFEHIPAALKAEPRWCVWKYLLDSQRRKWVKTPINAATLRNAKSNDPATWADYDTAVKALHRDASLAGLGFFLGEGWTGVDIDDCHDFLDGFNDIAADILERAPGYAEVSPSATGVKIILRAPIPRSKQTKRGDTGLEIYDHGRTVAA